MTNAEATFRECQTPKTCAKCGAVHDATRWALLSFVGLQSVDEETLELRNCRCGSTLSVAVQPGTDTLEGVAPVRAGSAPTPTRAPVPGRYSFVHEAYLRRLAESTTRGVA
ncbi:MAG TPA: hypothetical protein VH062_01895 [Polyangiaceae bacterium]|nr:hypothetical protein [Polyangiaceae bacterium]